MKNFLGRFIPLFLMYFIILSSGVYAATETYTIQKGDSLWMIAKKYQVGISEIINANPQIKNPDMVFPGDKIYIPLENPEVLSLEEEVVKLCNAHRSKQGIAPLTLNWELSRVARYKSNEMRDKNYFSHTSPMYGSPFDMLKKFNVKYSTAGENIAKGQKTAEAVVNSWMNSEGHRKNILNGNFTEIGVGFSSGNGSSYWTQMFIKP